MTLMWKKLVILVVLYACFSRDVWCYPTGAPASACVDLLPGHRSTTNQQIQPQASSSSLWVLTPSSLDYTVEQTITVEIAEKNGNIVQFLGFLMQARRVDTGTPVGTFIPPADGGAKGLTCSNVNDSITHSDKSAKFPSYFLEWKAPSALVGDIEFLVTIVYSEDIFWTRINSAVLTPRSSDPCDPTPCLNGGTCFRNADGRSYYCGCVDPTNTNRHCEVTVTSGTPMCSSNPCLNNGYCQERNGSFVCYCPGTHHGTVCEHLIIACSTNPCLNGGTCTDHSTGHLCECPFGFTGPDCSTVSNNACGTSNCQNGGTCFQNDFGTTICFCPESYEGDYCETMIIHPCSLPVSPCLNGGVCFRSGTVSDGYLCSCATGFSGIHCEVQAGNPCDSNPCVNGGSCQAENSNTAYTCTCPPQFTGNNCELQGACFGVSCTNRGTCVPANDGISYTCSCQAAYLGDNCEYTNQCILSNQCAEGSTCVYTEQNNFDCQCRPGFGGTFCELDTSCSFRTCLNGGTCIKVGDGTYTCTCVPTYSGINCEIYTDPCTPDPCVNGECRINFESPSGRTCNCDENYMGENCSMYSGDPCSVFSCYNGGTCLNNNQQATCVCQEDYSGVNCEIALNVPPVLTGCPSSLTVPMTAGTKTAYIDLVITATDKDSNTLPVVTVGNPTLTFPTTITFTEEYREGKSFTLRATDSGSRVSECNFTIRITDQEVPVVMCPDDVSDITIGDSKAVQWLPATATDNLGLESENAIQYTPQNRSNFKASADGFRSTVLVEARDTFGNIGECQFTVTVYKKEKDCAVFSPPDNGQANCFVDGADRQCEVECNPGFGNAVDSNVYECQYGGNTATWDPRPNSNICVPLKPGNGVNKVVTIKFPVDSSQCDSANLATSSLMDSLTSLGVCNSNDTKCQLAMSCGDDGDGARRKRAPAELTADITITGVASDEDTTVDVMEKLDTSVDAATTAAATGLLTVRVDEATISNDQSSIGVSDYTWECNAGQISSPDGCLSCPPGTFHDAASNQCKYCQLNSYQNKAEQDSCTMCPEGTPGNQLVGAYREDQCGEKQAVTGPWTPTLIAIVGAAGGLIVLLIVILCCVFIVKASRSPSKHDGSGKQNGDGPLSNFSHLNRAYEEDNGETEMQFHGGISATSDTTYQNVGDDAMDTASTDHLVRIPSLSQYSDYYATLNARSAPVFDDDEPVPTTPPPPPPVSPPQPPSGGAPKPPPPPPAPASELNSNNSNTSTLVKHNGSVMNGGSRAKFQV
ncbi:uncharacterized protein [Asterias amurensis]|uniref:uncharacterized protein isoform X2 n=1 Tax=Asterias amurensis TaxID=7602 RepID=UPI003AB7C0FE